VIALAIAAGLGVMLAVSTQAGDEPRS
jgi:hypothetical protein